jgi:hypothetical protein
LSRPRLTAEVDPLRTFDIIKASGRHRMGRGVRLSDGSFVHTSAPRPNGGLLPADPPTFNDGTLSCKSGDGLEVAAPHLRTDPAGHELAVIRREQVHAPPAVLAAVRPVPGGRHFRSGPSGSSGTAAEGTPHADTAGNPFGETCANAGLPPQENDKDGDAHRIIRRIVPGSDGAPMVKPFSRSLARKRMQARDRPRARRAGSALSRP